MQPLAVSATPALPIGEKIQRTRVMDDEGAKPATSSLLSRRATAQKSSLSLRSQTSTHSRTGEANGAGGGTGASSIGGRRHPRAIPAPEPIITISPSGAASSGTGTAHKGDPATGLSSNHHHRRSRSGSNTHTHGRKSSVSRQPSVPSIRTELEDELDYVTVDHPAGGPVEHIAPLSSPSSAVVPARDKAARVLGIRHRQSMEPIPGSNRNSLASARSAPPSVSAPPPSPSGPTMPLASLYVVSGLPKSPHTWTLADPDAVMGLHHAEGAVSRWWRPEVLGSTISPGTSGGKRKKKGKGGDDASPAAAAFSSSGYLSKQDVGKMLSKALKVSTPLTVS